MIYLFIMLYVIIKGLRAYNYNLHNIIEYYKKYILNLLKVNC